MSSNPPVLIADIPSLGMTMGGPLAGLSITALLYGISIPQLVIYYRRYPHDPRLFRYFIVLLWMLDAVQLALISAALYFYLVTSHGNYQALLQFTWTIPSQHTVSRVIVVGIQMLYAIRIWKLGRHFCIILPWCSLIAVAATVATVIYAIHASYGSQDLLTLSSVRVPIVTVFATTSTSDIVIAGIMCFCLHKGREMTRMSSTIKVIARLMRLVLMSGLVTSVCSLLVLVSVIVWPESLIFLAFDMIISKLYMNSLLAMLNSRKIPTELAIDLGHAVSAPSSGTILEFAPTESSDAAV